ncbi:unnamed protein product [Pleuronectes platessa]|uniref:Uncharacterized protein n=1 Tax=Pleuronectes platessa TaxID=8262 RepID=A0A9N7TRN1_PLEPL|nr:unnamed protein product [Pleuronectes platessa]
MLAFALGPDKLRHALSLPSAPPLPSISNPAESDKDTHSDSSSQQKLRVQLMGLSGSLQSVYRERKRRSSAQSSASSSSSSSSSYGLHSCTAAAPPAVLPMEVPLPLLFPQQASTHGLLTVTI